MTVAILRDADVSANRKDSNQDRRTIVALLMKSLLALCLPVLVFGLADLSQAQKPPSSKRSRQAARRLQPALQRALTVQGIV